MTLVGGEKLKVRKESGSGPSTGDGGMARLALGRGAAAGAIIIAGVIAVMELGAGQEWLGYLIMFAVFSAAIFGALRRYRIPDGAPPLRRGLQLGIAIAATAGAVYVLAWEAYLHLTDFRFTQVYFDGMLARARASGADAAEMAALTEQAETMRARYGDPLFRLPVTFLEVFPPGLLVSVAAAFFVRRRTAARAVSPRGAGAD